MRKRPLKPSTWLLGTLIACCAVFANAQSCPGTDPAALKWLDKMSRSSHEVSYHGTVTFQRGENKNLQVMQVSHSVANGIATESLTRLTGQGAKVVRIDHPLECVHPGHKLLRLGEAIRAGECGIAGHYHIRLGQEGSRIAGRLAVSVEVEPRDIYRYGYAMDLDRETGLLLRAQILDSTGEALERFQFANLSYTDSGPGVAEVEIVHKASHPPAQSLPESSASLASSAWVTRWLPQGFTSTDSPSAASHRKTYTDGLAVFSVFLEDLPEGLVPGDGLVRRGGTISYTLGMQLSGRPVLVTVIGEVPPATATRVASSIAWTQ